MKNSTTTADSGVVPVGLVQMACEPNKQVNVDRALDGIGQAAQAGAKIVCLQELFHGLYPCQSEDHARFAEAESIPGPTTERLAETAKRLGVVVIGSIFERRAPGIYHNTAVVLDVDGTVRGIYRKMHIPDDPLYYEKFYFTPGDLGFRSFATRFARIGVCVCWDQWFPEAARLTALTGSQILFYPTAIGWLPGEKQQWGRQQHDAWETMMRSHAIANGIYVAAANRVGTESALEFWGASFVADPYGQIVHRAVQTGPEVVVVDCDLNRIEVARTHWPFLRDRRVDAYAQLTQRYLDQ